MRGWSLGTGAACRAVGLRSGRSAQWPPTKTKRIQTSLSRLGLILPTTSYFSFQSALVEPLASYASMEVVVGNCEPKLGFPKRTPKGSVLLFRLCGLWRRGSHRRPCRNHVASHMFGQEAGAPSAAIWPMVLSRLSTTPVCLATRPASPRELLSKKTRRKLLVWAAHGGIEGSNPLSGPCATLRGEAPRKKQKTFAGRW